MSAVPPVLLPIAVTLVLPVSRPADGSPTNQKTFRLQLLKCYSHKFILQGFHHSPLTVNDNLCYFSSSSLWEDYSTFNCALSIYLWIFLRYVLLTGNGSSVLQFKFFTPSVTLAELSPASIVQLSWTHEKSAPSSHTKLALFLNRIHIYSINFNYQLNKVIS